MIEVSRLKDLNAAKRPWFPHTGHQSSRLCRLSSTGSTRSPEAEEALRRQDVRWRADGRCTQSIRRTLRVARPRSSLRIFLARCIPNRCISLFFSSFLFVGWGPARTAVADFSVTVSSNEAQHTLIQKSLCQQVLLVVSPAG